MTAIPAATKDYLLETYNRTGDNKAPGLDRVPNKTHIYGRWAVRAVHVREEIAHITEAAEAGAAANIW